MPRQPRIDIEGGLYHIYNRGIRKENIFRDESDYMFFLESISRSSKKYSFRLYAYVLMPNHFHFLIERSEDSLSLIMKSISVRYASYFNKKYYRTGHLFQGRFNSLVCSRENYLLRLLRYIHLNPVRAGIVNNPSDWDWSSHRYYLGEKPVIPVDTNTVFGLFSHDTPSDYYVSYMNEVDYIDKNEIYPPSTVPVVGDSEFKLGVLKKNRYRRKTPESRRVSLEQLSDKVADAYSIKPEDLRLKKGNSQVCRGRTLFCYIANRYCGHGTVEIAKFINKDHSTVSHALSRIIKNMNQEEIEQAVSKVLS